MGSRTPISITLLVKNPAFRRTKASIYYKDIGDYLGKDDKLKKLRELGSILSPAMELSSISPNEAYDWINQRDNLFETFIPLEPAKKFECKSKSVFVVNSRGFETARDSWVYNFSSKVLINNIQAFVAYYNQQIDEYERRNDKTMKLEDFISYDSTKISWSSSLISHAQRCLHIDVQPDRVVIGMYRPFCKQQLYVGEKMIHRRGQYDDFFPTPQSKNLVICVPGIGSNKGFSALMVDCIPDVQLQFNGQCFPLYYYDRMEQEQISLFDQSNEGEYRTRSGISNFILERARMQYGPKISNEDVFYYVYGLLHSVEYRIRFAHDLTKMLPRIFLIDSPKDFKNISSIGKELAELHVNYEAAEIWKEAIITGGDHNNFRVEKMKFAKLGKEEDKRCILFNESIKIENIPLAAYEYTINGKSAIEWLMERYQITTHAESKILNDPNEWAINNENTRYILELILRMITVSMKTMNLVKKLPKIEFLSD